MAGAAVKVIDEWVFGWRGEENAFGSRKIFINNNLGFFVEIVGGVKNLDRD